MDTIHFLYKFSFPENDLLFFAELKKLFFESIQYGCFQYFTINIF